MRYIFEDKERIFQFLKFSIVGTLGFLVDVGCFFCLSSLLGHFFSRIISFLAAVLFTYVLNKTLIFGLISSSLGFWKQLIPYLISMLAGGSVNLITFFILDWTIVFISQRPFLGIAIGSLAGLLVNFSVSIKIFNKK